MIYLTTGTNGAGKTLLTLRDVRDQQIREGRPVYFRGFTAGKQLLDWGWQEFKAEDWQQLPDGSICVFDEAQEVFPTRGRGEPPQWIEDIAKYRRKRGMDFWLVCPHPMLLDVFIRRLVEKPSWHRHLKRLGGGKMVSELKFDYVEQQCEKPGIGEKAQVKMRGYPVEVFDWYESASLHTVQKSIPKAVWVLLGTLVLALGLMGWVGYGLWAKAKRATNPPDRAAVGPVTAVPTAAPMQAVQAAAISAPAAVMTAADYVQARTPRIPGFSHTAPIYDGVTAPKEAPYPAACIEGKRPGQKAVSCECYTQQGTKLVVPQAVCTQIAANGFFVEWGI